MTGFRAAILLIIFLALGPAWGQDAPATQPTGETATGPTKQQIERAVAELGADSYATREAATRRLWGWGAAAEQALEAAAQSDDAEVINRATELLDRIAWGLSPDAPRDLIQQIKQFREGNEHVRINAVRIIASNPKYSTRVLLRLLGKAESARVIDAIKAQLFDSFDHRVLTLAGEGKTDELKNLLDQLAPHLDRATAPTAALFYRTNNLAPPEALSKHLAFWVNRLAGEKKQSLRMAYDLGDELMVEALYIERNNWKELAALYPKQRIETGLPRPLGFNQREGDSPWKIALRAAVYHDLAGNEDLAKLARERVRGELKVGDAASGEALGALLMLGEDLEWFESHLLKEHGSNDDRYTWANAADDYDGLVKVFEKIIDEAQTREDRQQAQVSLAIAEVYFGHHERGREILEQVAQSDGEQIAMVAALTLALEFDTDAGAKLLEKLEEAAGGEPAYLHAVTEATVEWARWYHLMHETGMSNAKAVRTIAAVTSADGPKDTYDKWIDAALRSDQPMTPFASTVLRREGRDAAVAFCEKRLARMRADAGNQHRQPEYQLYRFAHWLSAVGLHDRAVDEMAEAVNLKPHDGYMLLGLAQMQLAAGRVDAAKQTLERAEPVLIYNIYHRQTAAALWEKIDTDQADRLHALGELMFPMSNPHARSWTEQRMLERAIERGNVGEAGLRAKRLRAWLAATGPGSVIDGAHRRTRNHQAAARVALAAGDIDRAKAASLEAFATAGQNVQVHIDLVTAFDHADQRAAGDELFQAAWATYFPRAKRHPDATTINNQIAWMAARCRRNIDHAIKLAERGTAAEPQPQSGAALDTLAELYFQAGRNEDAIKTMKRCLEIDPADGYFHRQLARFKRGDPTTEPEEPE